jgi:hypothetical protein
MILLEGSQAMPTRPSEKGRIRVKTSECYWVEAWARDKGILILENVFWNDNLNRKVIWWPL